MTIAKPTVKTGISNTNSKEQYSIHATELFPAVLSRAAGSPLPSCH